MNARRMRVCAALFIALLTACAPAVRGPNAVPPEETGEVVAGHLQDRFDGLETGCRGDHIPAVLCSGVLMRGTTWSTGFHSWVPNPATSAGGVSFSWLRQDSNFPQAAYPNGFIVYPHFYSDDPYFYQLTVKCVYVLNASTAGTADRCRTPCHAQGVITASQWLAKYPSGYGCAFKIDPADAAPNPGEAWMQMVAVRKARNLFTWNEVIVPAWPQTTHADMPLEAFFYQSGSSAGLANAKKDQADFLATAKRWVPVIRWTPASGMTGRATFTYAAADQGP